jgi:hypothetical protein
LTSGEHYNIHHRALEKDPEDRYQSVADMVGELRREQKKPARVTRPPMPNALADVLHAGSAPIEEYRIGTQIPYPTPLKTSAKNDGSYRKHWRK